MKKLLIVVILLSVFSVISYAQDELLQKPFFSFDEFKESVSGVSVPGFDGVSEWEDNQEEGEYLAIFLKGTAILFIKIEYREHKGMVESLYYLDGEGADFYTLNDLAMLMVDLPETNSILTIASNKLMTQVELEKIARQTGILDLEAPIAQWPAIIPAEFRIEGTLLEAKTSEGSDTGHYSSEVRVTLVMSDRVIKSLKQMLIDYDGSEEVFIRFPDGIILNLPLNGIDEIVDYYPKDSLIRFIYYMP